MKEKTEEDIIREYSVQTGEAPSGGVWRVMRSFYLKIKNGPLCPLTPGVLAELSKETANLNFYIGRIEPLDISREFEVTRKFRTVINGLYCNLRPGDRIELERGEALDLMRKGVVEGIYSEVTK
jgi:hypothetical protein